MKDKDGVIMPRTISPKNFDGRRMKLKRNDWWIRRLPVCKSCGKGRYSHTKLTGRLCCKKCNYMPAGE